MEPFLINVSLNQEQNGAVFHIDCESDARVERWMEGGEEASTQAKKLWLGKLGCLLKFHGNIEYVFHDPWAYKISDFPKNYKLFVVERKTQEGDPPRQDCYLYGGHHKYRSAQEFYPHLYWLLNNTQGVKKPCICQYCDDTRTQEEINKIFPLPPGKESAKGPRGPKKQKQTRTLKGPQGVTSKRVLITNRNSITTGPITTLGHGLQDHKTIGYRKSHPFQ